MKKSIFPFVLALAASFTALAQADLTASESAKMTHRLFRNFFASSCATLPQVAICDFNLQNQILATTENTFDQATLSMTTLPSVHAQIAAKSLSEKYNLDYQTTLQSASLLEAWVKRTQSHANKTSQAEIESVYLLAIGVGQQEVLRQAQSQDAKGLDQVAEALAQKFRTSSRDAKIFLENVLLSGSAE